MYLAHETARSMTRVTNILRLDNTHTLVVDNTQPCHHPSSIAKFHHLRRLSMANEIECDVPADIHNNIDS